MEKNKIISFLKSKCSSAVRLPRDLDVEIIDNELLINLKGDKVVENMQTDASAFEGWAIVVKSWIDEVESVIIKWDKPIWNKEKKENQKLHYERFLYRVKRFSQSYDWLKVSDFNLSDLDELKIDKYSDREFVLNSPSKARDRRIYSVKDLSEYKESELEEYLVAVKSEELKKVADLKYIDNQFPVGCFDSVVSKNTKVFTGGKSAIDIWGISNSGEFCLFELKIPKNNKVGAISEMLFYSYIIQDILIGKIKLTSSENIIKNVPQLTAVCTYLLAPNKHILLSENVFATLNKSKSNIRFDFIEIVKEKDEMKFNKYNF